MFCEERVAQMAAFLLQQGGGRMPGLKLMKLLYLADRAYLTRFGESMSGDCMVSMPHGPALSQTEDLIICGSRQDEGWADWISSDGQGEISTKCPGAGREDFDLLSDVELETLTHVWRRFGCMNKWQLVDYARQHCLEWQDPHGSAFPIKEEALFLAVGKSPDMTQSMALRLREQRQLDKTILQLM